MNVSYARLGDVVRDHARTPVFVTGGPPRAPFPGPGAASWPNPAYALHHARSWDSPLALGTMVPLKAAAWPAQRAGARLLAGMRETLGELATSPLPVVAQIWGPMTLAATQVGTEEYLLALRDTARAFALTQSGLEASLVSASAALESRPLVLWIAEPLAAIVDPATLDSVWPHTMRQLIAAARTAGADVVLHVSGTATHVLPTAARLGVSGVSITGDTPLETAREILGGHVVVCGNLDSMRLLDHDEGWLASAAREMVATMHGHPFVVTPGSAVPPGTTTRRLAAFVDAARE